MSVWIYGNANRGSARQFRSNSTTKRFETHHGSKSTSTPKQSTTRTPSTAFENAAAPVNSLTNQYRHFVEQENTRPSDVPQNSQMDVGVEGWNTGRKQLRGL